MQNRHCHAKKAGSLATFSKLNRQIFYAKGKKKKTGAHYGYVNLYTHATVIMNNGGRETATLLCLAAEKKKKKKTSCCPTDLAVYWYCHSV